MKLSVKVGEIRGTSDNVSKNDCFVYCDLIIHIYFQFKGILFTTCVVCEMIYEMRG